MRVQMVEAGLGILTFTEWTVVTQQETKHTLSSSLDSSDYLPWSDDVSGGVRPRTFAVYWEDGSIRDGNILSRS